MPSTVVLASRYGLPLDTPPEFVWGYADTMRMDSVRPSCMECVEKHLGAALVLMGEAEAGYPEHKLLAIGHLHEAAEESADMRPELSALLRDIRKRYQQGEAIEFETILEALNQHGVWRFDQRGQGVACGNGWIPRSKKCSRDKAAQTSKEAKAKTVEKSKARGELKRAVKAGKGQKARVKEKASTLRQEVEKEFLQRKSEGQSRAAQNVQGYQPQKGDRVNIAGTLNKNIEGDWLIYSANDDRVSLSKMKNGEVMPPSKKNMLTLDRPQLKVMMESGSAVVSGSNGSKKPLPAADKNLQDIEQTKVALRNLYAQRDNFYRMNRSFMGRTPLDDSIDLMESDLEKLARTDSYIQGYLEVMSWRFDRKGEGVACGRGWISRRKKCGRDKSRITSPEAKARTVEKQKERQQLRGQVRAAKGMKPYVKPKPEPAAPQGMPHKNPKTPQEFIENGRAVAGAFLANAKKLDSDIAAQQQAVADGVKRVNEAKLIARQEASAEVQKTLADDPKYQEARRRQEEQKQLFDEVSERYARYEATSTETNRIAAAKIEADLVVMQIRDRKIDELVDQHPEVAKARKARDEAQQKLTKLTAPAVEFKQQLISTSTMPRSEAEARAKKVKKPPKAKDPGLSDQIADFNQLTNGAPTTLNRITITEKRAHATRDGLARYHGPGSEPTLWHEMAHHLEYADPAMAKVAEDWVKSRATGPEESLRKLTGNNRYDRSEKAYPDHFIDPYVGKVYEGGATEVLSMGLEAFSSPERMIQLAAKDPDHFALVLGLTRRPE